MTVVSGDYPKLVIASSIYIYIYILVFNGEYSDI